ncbi:hypothetical protein [Nocardioides sp.]|uniref:hypothetical protein n=1 Tax=Nocardioides sp. TaxID=35761 RepID=UPI002D11FFB1|nr:hypothetical protein [Nocardioides sp.]HXH77976.1 hypothetical protein [Nocardioides sp.]
MAGLSLFLGLVVLAGLVLSGRGERYEADLSRQGPPTAQSGAAAGAVQDLLSALEAGDPEGAAELAADGDAAARDQLADAATNARVLDLTELSARYVDEVGAVSPDGSWTAAVALTWAIAGFDEEPARAEVLVDFAGDGDRVVIAGLGGGDRISPLWWGQRLAVRRTDTALVMAAGDDAARQVRTYLQRVRRAIPVVSRVLPQWRPSVVMEVPASAAGLDASLDVAEGTYSAIAAVTAQADGSGRSDAPVRVFVNPEVTGRLRGAGAQVVISHELVHVATDAPNAVIDPWLLEGFADYVALRDIDLPLDVTAARARASVRRSGVPDRLPGTAEFDVAADDLAAAYEMAWLACVEVAAQVGEQGLVRVYELASEGKSTRAALASVGLTPDEVVAAWQQRLRRLAS